MSITKPVGSKGLRSLDNLTQKHLYFDKPSDSSKLYANSSLKDLIGVKKQLKHVKTLKP